MPIDWNARACRWFEAASAYTGYHQKLTEILKRYIPCGESLCDLGCGAGLIDLALAEHCSAVTGIDRAPGAIAYLQASAARRSITNLRALCMDAAAFLTPHDTVTAFFLGERRFYERYFRLARKRMIVAVHGRRTGTIGPEGYRTVQHTDADEARACLDGLGVQYDYEAVRLEYGQPFSDLDDAREFVRAYARPMGEDVLERYLAEQLTGTGDPVWPYYLPKQKEIGLFIIRREEAPVRSG